MFGRVGPRARAGSGRIRAARGQARRGDSWRMVSLPVTQSVQFGISLPNRAVLFGLSPHVLLETAEHADASGFFDSVWVGDNLLSKPRLESIVTLSALAARTRRLQAWGGLPRELHAAAPADRGDPVGQPRRALGGAHDPGGLHRRLRGDGSAVCERAGGLWGAVERAGAANGGGDRVAPRLLGPRARVPSRPVLHLRAGPGAAQAGPAARSYRHRVESRGRTGTPRSRSASSAGSRGSPTAGRRMGRRLTCSGIDGPGFASTRPRPGGPTRSRMRAST